MPYRKDEGYFRRVVMQAALRKEQGAALRKNAMEKIKEVARLAGLLLMPRL